MSADFGPGQKPELFACHFAEVAGVYDGVRITDAAPITFIAESLSAWPEVLGIELGPGSGRYTRSLLESLGSRLRLQCLDTSFDMLAELAANLDGHYQGGYIAVQGSAEEAPFNHGDYDVVFSFNALHHMDLHKTLVNIRSWLRPGGLAFLYTRTPDQNSQNLWGRFFPGFAEKETRLFSENVLRQTIGELRNLEEAQMVEFRYDRQADLATLLTRLDNNHYSTFRLFNPEELKEARRVFIEKLQSEFGEGPITWQDSNLMVVLKRT